jgi:hypothetical protein
LESGGCGLAEGIESDDPPTGATFLSNGGSKKDLKCYEMVLKYGR